MPTDLPTGHSPLPSHTRHRAPTRYPPACLLLRGCMSRGKGSSPGAIRSWGPNRPGSSSSSSRGWECSPKRNSMRSCEAASAISTSPPRACIRPCCMLFGQSSAMRRVGTHRFHQLCIELPAVAAWRGRHRQHVQPLLPVVQAVDDQELLRVHRVVERSAGELKVDANVHCPRCANPGRAAVGTVGGFRLLWALCMACSCEA
jgi:hypothetical protein